ncbi:hypothetical protein D187_004117 [Cystobacter fuscus DSM 2262]|uniref:Uncharacterized protein n=1 Tax=Cystobacter fuscus (strain ATCC 25194 / DSM 2262 / NBRC 100088 / M29) TaxID=1242864 RepID=S9P579_CYSF2|nr:hypothetical protein D187_004117 [Cystobacter fuscus DSM 2262]
MPFITKWLANAWRSVCQHLTESCPTRLPFGGEARAAAVLSDPGLFFLSA